MENRTRSALLYTINDAENLGQIFSTYSLYKTMQKLGYNPVVYDEIVQLHTKASEYIKTHCCVSSDMHIHNSTEEYRENFEILLTGSDRIWKHSEEENVDISFLNWGKKDAVRIAYAPSFGERCELPLGPKNAAFFAMDKFRGISAADKNTRNILNLEFGIDAETVCSPMLLLDQYPHLNSSQTEGLFIFVFFERWNGQKQKAAEMAEEILKYQVVDFGMSADNNADSSTDRTADEYLSAIQNSSLIVTDSAAIMHLAITYKKPFIMAVSQRDKASSESMSTLEALGLTERAVYMEEDVREKKYLCRKPIRYGLVDYKLSMLRSKSIEWLADKLR